jgi:hypothetical protein
MKIVFHFSICCVECLRFRYYSFSPSTAIPSFFLFSLCSLCLHYYLYLPIYPSSVCFHIYRSVIFLLLNELLPSSHISFFIVSLHFHFSGSFFFVFFVISLFHSSSYSFSFISSLIIFFIAFSPLCFSSSNPLSFFYFLFSVLLLFFCVSLRSRFKASYSVKLLS